MSSKRSDHNTYPNAKCRPIPAYENGAKVIVSLPGFGDPDVDYPAYASLLELGFEYARLLAASKAITSPNESIDLDAVIAKVNDVKEAVERFKWGNTVTINGTSDFKDKALRLAVERGIHVIIRSCKTAA